MHIGASGCRRMLYRLMTRRDVLNRVALHVLPPPRREGGHAFRCTEILRATGGSSPTIRGLLSWLRLLTWLGHPQTRAATGKLSDSCPRVRQP